MVRKNDAVCLASLGAYVGVVDYSVSMSAHTTLNGLSQKLFIDFAGTSLGLRSDSRFKFRCRDEVAIVMITRTAAANCVLFKGTTYIELMGH